MSHEGSFYTRDPRRCEDDFDQYTEDEDQTVVSDIEEVTIRDRSFIGVSRCDKDNFMRFQLVWGESMNILVIKHELQTLHIGNLATYPSIQAFQMFVAIQQIVNK